MAGEETLSGLLPGSGRLRNVGNEFGCVAVDAVVITSIPASNWDSSPEKNVVMSPLHLKM